MHAQERQVFSALSQAAQIYTGSSLDKLIAFNTDPIIVHKLL
jgi:hypothetical protein